MAIASSKQDEAGKSGAAEFASEWHRDAHIAALEREAEGARVAGRDVEHENAVRELTRLGVTKTDRQAGGGAQKR